MPNEIHIQAVIDREEAEGFITLTLDRREADALRWALGHAYSNRPDGKHHVPMASDSGFEQHQRMQMVLIRKFEVEEDKSNAIWDAARRHDAGPLNRVLQHTMKELKAAIKGQDYAPSGLGQMYRDELDEWLRGLHLDFQIHLWTVLTGSPW